jgi:cobalt-zinc-cadmium efflux system membrane fusion protein
VLAGLTFQSRARFRLGEVNTPSFQPKNPSGGSMRHPPVSRNPILVATLVVFACSVAALWAPPAWAHAGHDHAFSQTAPGQAVTQLEISAEGQKSIGLQITEAATRSLTPGVVTTGRIEPDPRHTFVVTPQATGRITRLMAGIGDRVSAGTPLMAITSPEIGQAQFELIQALNRTAGERLAAQAELKLARSNQARVRSLYTAGVTAGKEVQAADNDVQLRQISIGTLERESALAAQTLRDRLQALGVSKAQANRVIAQRRASDTLVIAAPGPGVVVERTVTLGQTAGPDTKAFTITDPTHVWATADIYERDLSMVTKGQRAEVSVAGSPGVTVTGNVTQVPSVVDPDKHTAALHIALSSPGALRPGMFATIRVVAGKQQQGLAIPQSAVLTDNGSSTVWLKNGDEQFESQSIKTGTVAGDWVQVTEGISEGDQVVSRGAFQLKAEAIKQAGQPAAHADEESSPASTADTAKVPASPRPMMPWLLGLGALLVLALLVWFLRSFRIVPRTPTRRPGDRDV